MLLLICRFVSICLAGAQSAEKIWFPCKTSARGVFSLPRVPVWRKGLAEPVSVSTDPAPLKKPARFCYSATLRFQINFQPCTFICYAHRHRQSRVCLHFLNQHLLEDLAKQVCPCFAKVSFCVLPERGVCSAQGNLMPGLRNSVVGTTQEN